MSKTESITLNYRQRHKAVEFCLKRGCWFQLDPRPRGKYVLTFEAGEGYADSLKFHLDHVPKDPKDLAILRLKELIEEVPDIILERAESILKSGGVDTDGWPGEYTLAKSLLCASLAEVDHRFGSGYARGVIEELKKL